MTQKSIKIGDFLLRKKDIITVQDDQKYKRITIRMNKLGVLQRDEVMGVDIGTKKQYIVKGGEFIISKIDARNGAFGIVPESLKGAIITGDFLAYDINTELVDMDFFLAFISLNNFEKICAQASSGTTNRQRLNEPKFLNFEIQIPGTTGEQKEMMKKYAEYKKGFSELKNLSEKNEKLIKSLKSSILQDAIQGKLVPQDLSDEPASILIERIQAEKTKLIAEGKLRKTEKLPEIQPTEKLHLLPPNWEFCRLGNFTINRDGERIPLSEIDRRGVSKIYDYYGASGVIDKVDKFLFDKELLLIGEDGANLLTRSKPIAFFAKGKYWVNNHAHVLDGVYNINLKYLCIYISGISLKPYVTGTAQPKMNQSKMNNIIVPVPPLREQERIVEKVEELMQSCELLDEQVKQAKERSEKLMESVLQGVFNG